MTFEEVSDSPFSLNVDIFARFAHGMKVKGELTLRCLPVDKETSNENDNKEASSTARKILSTQLLEGHWSGKLDLKVCGVTEEKHQKIKLIAEVTERGSFLSAKTVKEWDLFNPGFELIPLKPAFTRNTRRMLIYLRRRFLIEGDAELTTQCISEERSLNGLNHSLIQRLGTIAEIKLTLDAYLILLSTSETLVLPLLDGFDKFDLSLIEINQNKVEYIEGEFIEAIIHNVTGRNFNYALICGNGRELASVGPIKDGRVRVQITEQMGTGACVLYVYGSNGKIQKWLWICTLFLKGLDIVLRSDYGIIIPNENVTVGVPINITLRSQPNSLATLHIYDSRLDALIKQSVSSTSNNQLWTFSEFLNPEPGEHYFENFIWFSNVLELSKLFAKRKEICQNAGKLAPQCPVEGTEQISNAHIQPSSKTRIPISASRFSTECLREIQGECERQKTIRESANGFLTEKSQNNQQQNAWPIKTSGNDNQLMWMLNKKSYVQNVQEASNNVEMDDLKAN
uniref:Uncharacterized protein n=1 Tax=Meloidogyne enterolobii TaxID=390850 RepID=A0A6V7TSD6_MELEN|nr:unnamed protein product [Meloidogyne enterolobii]